LPPSEFCPISSPAARNYFGMMQPAIELQQKGEAPSSVVDYHSMASLFDAIERRKNTRGAELNFPTCAFMCRALARW
jgi:tryptophanyl-tRNA synthetase